MDYSKYCSLTYNGILLDNAIDGYLTINVEGRGLLNRNISAIDIPGQEGQSITDYKIQSRNIIVHYLLKASNSKAFMKRLHLLHEYLFSNEDVVFQFGDEPYYRLGRLYEVQDPPYDQLQGIGSFTIFCQNPYKFDVIRKLVGNPVTLISDSILPVHPDVILVTLKENADKLVVSNLGNGKRIIINDAFKIGDLVEIDIKSAEIKRNNQNIMSKLDYAETDFHEFMIKNNDQIIVGPVSSDLNISYRRKYL